MCNYLKGAFIIDFLSTFPFEYITENLLLNLFGLLKIVRVFRLGELINKSSLDEETKSLARICLIIFYLVMVMHLFAGVWNVVIDIAQVWYPPLDWVYAGGYPKIYRLYNEDEVDVWHRYYIFLYHSVLFLGGNEMGPRTEIELAASVLILIFMSVLNAALMGEMAVEVEKSGAKKVKFQT